MVMMLVLLMSPVRFAFARIPVDPVAPSIAMRPSFLTLLLLLMVTAAPPVGFTDPVELIRILSPAPAVVSGVVTAVLMTCSPEAGVARTTASAPRAVDARRDRIEKYPFPPAGTDGCRLSFARAFACS